MTRASRPGRTVLLTNVWLDRRGGSESVIRDVSLGLLARGWRPIVYSPHLGEPAAELEARGVATVSDLAQVAEPPEMIHGQHFVQTAEALFHFPAAPALQMCHAWVYWQERPVKFPQIRRYVAVDQAVRDRLVHTEGLAPERVEILLNAVDLRRIPERPAALPETPRRALAFTKGPSHIPALQRTCDRHGIKLDVLGAGGGRTVAAPEHELVKYDIVFATARMALEAACAGCAVVVCDSRGLAGMLTSEGLQPLRLLNFGLRALVREVTSETLSQEIARYDAADAAAVSESLRASANLELALDRLEGLYEDAMAAARRDPVDPAARRRAELAFLDEALPRLRKDGRWLWMSEREAMERRIQDLENRLAAAQAGLLARG